MTNEQLEQAFEQARQEWQAKHGYIDNMNLARFYFFAGSTFGCEVTADIYHRVYGDGVPKGEDVDGVPV